MKNKKRKNTIYNLLFILSLIVFLYSGYRLISYYFEYKKMDKINPNYNRFIMKYHNDYHKMIMPCGELIAANADPDEEEII